MWGTIVGWTQVILHYSIFLLLDVKLKKKKIIVRLDLLHILYMHAKFQNDQRLITKLYIKYLNSKFLYLKLRIK